MEKNNMADELEKKKKDAFSFLRAIGLGGNKDDKPSKNVFYAGNVVAAANKRKKELEKVNQD
jgi:hypothetical protein